MLTCPVCKKDYETAAKLKQHIGTKGHKDNLKSSGFTAADDPAKALLPATKPRAPSNKRVSSLPQGIDEIKQMFASLEQRVQEIERRLNIPRLQKRGQEKIESNARFKSELKQILAQLAPGLEVKGNYPLKDIRAQFQERFDISDEEFVKNILQLYRKQEIDLQAGGDASEYHVTSPTSKEFYYLIPHE